MRSSGTYRYRIARDLTSRCDVKAINRGEGFLMIFDRTTDVAGFASTYDALEVMRTR